MQTYDMEQGGCGHGAHGAKHGTKVRAYRVRCLGPVVRPLAVGRPLEALLEAEAARSEAKEAATDRAGGAAAGLN